MARVKKKVPRFQVWFTTPTSARLNGLPFWRKRLYWDSGIFRMISIGPLNLVWNYVPQYHVFDEDV